MPPGAPFEVALPAQQPQPPQPQPVVEMGRLAEQDITVKIPPNAKAGTKFPYTAPDGATVYLVCPKPKPSSGLMTWRFIPRGVRPDQAAMRQAVMQAPPVQAVRMAPAPGSMMNVTVPPGACGGHSLQVNTPVGPLCVQVPPALREGDTFTIELPAQTAVAMPGACASASGAVAMGRPV